MVKTKNLKDSFLWGNDLINMFQWHEWITTPASLVVNIFDDNNSLKSVITQYTLCIDDEVIQVDRVEDLKYYLDLIRKQYDLGGGNHKSFDEKERHIILWTYQLNEIYQFLKNDFDCDSFPEEGTDKLQVMLDGAFCLRDISNITNKKFRDSLTLCGSPDEKLWTYDWNDQAIYAAYLYSFAKQYYKMTDNVPLTLQQLVVEDFKETKDKELIMDIYPDRSDYYKLGYSYIGGLCLVNPNYAKLDLQETLGHIDFKSSYLCRILTDYYPMSKFEDVTPDEKYLGSHCCLVKVRFRNLKANIAWLNAKFLVDSKNIVVDKNSHIKSAEIAEFYITEIDFELIKMTYTYDSYNISVMKIAERDFLPDYVRDVAEDLYIKKETLSGVDREWVKTQCEIIYGAMSKNQYNLEDKNWDYIKANAIFSPYWGIYTSAHARYELLSFIILLGDDFVYSDTDSVFFRNPYLHSQLILRYNTKRTSIMYDYCLERYQDTLWFNKLMDCGTFTLEDDSDYDNWTITRFKALGPKRYMYTANGKLITKIAGMKKQYKGKTVLEHLYGLDAYDHFNDNEKIPDIKKRQYYIDEPVALKIDGKTYKNNSYVFTGYYKTNKTLAQYFNEALEEVADNLNIKLMNGKEHR